MKKIRGLPVPHFKNTADCPPREIPVPPEVTLPMSMHSGAPAKPIVKAGDFVKVGQLIGEADTSRRVSSPVHASVSGKVIRIDSVDGLTGKKAASVVVASDGEQTVFEGLAPPVVTDKASFLEAVQNSGVVGLGGAGYPTAPKLTVKDGTKLDYILINGAECEPYITSDTRTMVDHAEYVWEGAKLLKEYLSPENVLICVEDNKPEAIKKLTDLCAGTAGIGVHVLPARYPQGERKVLVYNVTGRIVPEGGRLTDVGCIVINCTTVAVFARYIKTGMPLVSRTVTVDGSAVKEPQNVIAPIGTPIRALFDFCGGLGGDVSKVLLGGPMMGAAVPSLDIPVVKVTNAVLAFTGKDAQIAEPSPCIKCGRCISKCPMKLMPSMIEDAVELNKIALLEKYKVNMCAECACCAYLCPSKRPLSQVMSLAKNMLWEATRK
ncbi:MAG: electron transport complex subunit RsxC [Oscillospiraceae bacterium]|nr:electron transport complex subunit RsxC [Oscillospiraceae bacterium]